jgi:hypothetical protein
MRSALYTILSSDSTIVSFLGNGAASIYNERDLIADDNLVYPLIVLSYQGTKAASSCARDITTEEWTIRILNQNKGYATIDLVKNRCKQLLHNKEATVGTALLTVPSQYRLGRSILGSQWVWWTPEYYDVYFNAENGGARFRFTMQEVSYS